jgi:hypothetical protein
VNKCVIGTLLVTHFNKVWVVGGWAKSDFVVGRRKKEVGIISVARQSAFEGFQGNQMRVKFILEAGAHFYMEICN